MRNISTPEKRILSTLTMVSIGLFGITSFLIGRIHTTQSLTSRIDQVKGTYQSIITEQNTILEATNQSLVAITEELASRESLVKLTKNANSALNTKISNLNAKVAGVSTNKYPYPFFVPTVGFIGHQSGTYGGQMFGDTHLGVDIWTSVPNGGQISTHKGNPVYSACDGTVEVFKKDNGAVIIQCDTIPDYYNVPVHEGLRTYYGHMGNAITQEQYIYVRKGQQIKRGDFIGFQGDLSSFTPEMRNIHLHFSIFTGFTEKGGSIDPCKYIGGTCVKAGRFFIPTYQ